jgi:hypothetical protein
MDLGETPGLLILAGLALAFLAAVAWRRAGRWRSRVARGLARVLAAVMLVIGLIVLVLGGYFFWFLHRTPPEPTQSVLFDGAIYIRDVRREPRPLVIHVAVVDLGTPGLRFLVTPGATSGGRELRARTTSEFLDEFDLQLAINGDFFEPFWTNGPWDYYPHSGDPVDVSGLAVSRGETYSAAVDDRPVLYLTDDGRASFGVPPAGPYNAISGSFVFLAGGWPHPSGLEYHTALHPRSAVGLSADGQTLLLFVVDGRQPGYSEGVTLAELAAIAQQYGADSALNLDGGGSSTLVAAGPGGRPLQLNSPINHRIPGYERPVANHLGIAVTPP